MQQMNNAVLLLLLLPESRLLVRHGVVLLTEGILFFGNLGYILQMTWLR